MGKPLRAVGRSRSLTRFFRTVAIGLAIANLAAVGGYLGMRHYLSRDRLPESRRAPAAREEAVRLRRHANAAVRLMEDYLLRFPLTERSGSVRAEQWALREFRPKVEALRERLTHPGQGSTLLVELRALTDRMLTMAAHSSDQSLRRATVEQLAALCAEVEHHILGLGNVGRLDEPPLPFTVPD